MTETPPPPSQTGVERFFDRLRAVDVKRDTDSKWIGGVCSGVAARIGVDPVVVRLVAVLLLFVGGLGFAAYLVAWLLLPDRRGDIVAERGIRFGEVGPILLIALTVLVLFGFLSDGPGWGGPRWVLVPPLLLVAVGVIVWLVLRGRVPRDGAASPPPSGSGPAAPYGAGPGAPPPAPGATPPAGAGGAGAGTRPDAGAGGTPGGAGPTGPTSAGATSWSAAANAPYAAAAPPPAWAPPAGPSAPAGSSGPSGPSGPVTPGYAPPVPAPRPPRRRPRRAGVLAALVVGGLALASYGALVLLHDALGWAGDAHVVGLAGALAVLGAATLGFGAAGLRAGLTGVVAIVLAVVTAGAAFAPRVDWRGGVGDRYWQPETSVSRSYELGVGDATLDLTRYPTDPASPGEVRVDVGAGKVEIRIPREVTARVDGVVRAGSISVDGVDVPPSNRDRSRAGVDQTYGAGRPDVTVTVRLGAGDIQITKE